MSKPRFFVFAGLFSVGVLSGLTSCNAVTGASDIVLRGDEEPEDPFVNAAGVHIDSIDLYQGVKRSLMAGGVASTGGVAVVAGRDAIVRVFVTTDADYNNLPVTGRLYINDASEPIVVTKTFSGMAAQEQLDSTLNFAVPGAEIAPDMTYRVELKQDPGAKEALTGWKFPENDSEPIDVKSDGLALKLVLVPIQYGADGSNRLPDTSPEQVKAYADGFFAFYPIPSVDVQVRAEPLVWNKQVNAFGGPPDPKGEGPVDWIELRDAVQDLRVTDGVGEDVYYFGLFNPAASFDTFCGGGCILGIASIPGPGDSYKRGAIGLGYSGPMSVETAIHEIGHTFGRQHSPCGGAQADPAAGEVYPYPAGNVGVWGYNIVSNQLLTPDTGDVMSYCPPLWVSDYTFTKLFERFVIVNKAARIIHPPELLDRVYARVRIGANGTLKWRPSIKLHTPPVGFGTKDVTVMTDTGPEVITGQYYPNDHSDGGELIWPIPTGRAKSIQFELEGKARTLGNPR